MQAVYVMFVAFFITDGDLTGEGIISISPFETRADCEEVLEYALALVPEGSTVTQASCTIDETYDEGT